MEKEAEAQEGQVKKPESLGEETLGSPKRSPAGVGALDGEAELVAKAEKVRFSLVQVLEDLTSEELTEFKLSLLDHPAGRGIPRERLEKVDGTKLAELLVAYHGELTAWRLAVDFQHLMLAKNLKRQARVVEGTIGRPQERIQEARYAYQHHKRKEFYFMRNWKFHPWSHQFIQLILFERKQYQQELQVNKKKTRSLHNLHQRLKDSNFFDPDPKTGAQPQTVVLLGPPGIGKTTLSRKMMFDWAEGNLYQERFYFVFYFSCRELNNLGDMKTSFADLIFKLNRFYIPEYALTFIMSCPQRLLIIIDGLDELKFSCNDQRHNLCKHWNQQRPVPILLSSLLRKTLLPMAYFLLTMRDTALQKFIPLLKDAHYIEILGFSLAHRKEYFCNFFRDENLGKKVFSVIEGNDTLLTMCSVPLMIWIVCTCLKRQMEKGRDPIQYLKTPTALYIYYLSTLIPPNKNFEHQLLRALCSLAAEGIWKRKLLFDEEDLKRHGLKAANIFPFLDKNVFWRTHGLKESYSFIHQSLQEFFAAMFYVMPSTEEGLENPDSSIPNIKKLLEKCRKDGNSFTLPVVHSLFGFLNAKTASELERKLGCRMSLEIKSRLLQWVEGIIKRDKVFFNTPLPEWYSLLYETQDAEFVTRALVNLQEMRVNINHVYDALSAVFCIKHASRAQRIFFSYGYSHLPVGVWKDLFSVVSKNENLNEFTLNGYAPKFGDSSLEDLCMELTHQNCKLEKLKLQYCSFDSYDWRNLFFAIRENQQLRVFDMEGSYLSDWDVKKLCSELSFSDHKLKELYLDQAHFNENTKSCLQTLQKMKPHLITYFLRGTLLATSDLQVEPGKASPIFPKKHQQPEPDGDISIPPNWRSLETFWGPVGLVPIEVVDKSRNIYSVHFPRAGSYYWPHTGLGFEVRGAVSIKIEFASWSQHLDWKQQRQPGSIVAGPLFDISAEPGLVAAVHLPHFVSLKGCLIDVSIFQVAHFKKEGIVFEKPDKVEPFYIVLKDPDFSPVGVLSKLLSSFKRISVDASIQIYYKVFGGEISLHLYLIPDDISVRKVIDEEEKSFRFLRLNKPQLQNALKLGSSYSVCGSEHMTINPKVLLLKHRSHEKVQVFSEIHITALQKEIYLELKCKDGTVIWNVTIWPGEFVHAQVPPISPGSDFIGQHREQLIQRVTSVDALLDKLYDKVLNAEEYGTVRAESTNQSKMRKLLSFSSSWNNDHKRLFIEALIELHKFLVTDLLSEQGTAGAQGGCLHRFPFI